MRCMLALVLLILLSVPAGACSPQASSQIITSAPPPSPASAIALPAPRITGSMSLEEALSQRRSVREYSDTPMSLADISQLLWSAQGITNDAGNRAAPSAGGLYPLEVYFAAGNVEGLSAGVYRYVPQRHQIVKVKDMDVRTELARAAVDQSWVRQGAIVVVIAAVYERTTAKYSDRGITYVHMEAGHVAQNLCLQAVALSLGAVTVGAFYDDQVRGVMGMAENEVPLYVIPVGKKK